jgi:DNA-binding MarR family transcriptional regulator
MTAAESATDELRQELTSLNRLLVDFIMAANTLQPDRVRSGDDLSLAQGFMLMELGAHSPLSQRDLGERLGLGKSTVSRLISELDWLDLVERDRDPSNHRFHRVCLTTKGQTAAARVTEGYFGRHSELLMTLTVEERHALRTGVSALLRSLHSHSHSPAPRNAGPENHRLHP